MKAFGASGLFSMRVPRAKEKSVVPTTEITARGLWTRVALTAALSLPTVGLANAESDSQLAQELTNPVADLIQVPFQNNFDWGGGPRNDAFRYTLNVQPVIPITLTTPRIRILAVETIPSHKRPLRPSALRTPRRRASTYGVR